MPVVQSGFTRHMKKELMRYVRQQDLRLTIQYNNPTAPGTTASKSEEIESGQIHIQSSGRLAYNIETVFEDLTQNNHIYRAFLHTLEDDHTNDEYYIKWDFGQIDLDYGGSFTIINFSIEFE